MDKIEGIYMNTNFYRKSSEIDPYAMYIIFREELNMSVGKLGSQIGHGVQLAIEHFGSIENTANSDYSYELTPEEKNLWDRYLEWHQTGFTKITVKADDKEWKKLKETIPEF